MVLRFKLVIIINKTNFCVSYATIYDYIYRKMSVSYPITQTRVMPKVSLINELNNQTLFAELKGGTLHQICFTYICSKLPNSPITY